MTELEQEANTARQYRAWACASQTAAALQTLRDYPVQPDGYDGLVATLYGELLQLQVVAFEEGRVCGPRKEPQKRKGGKK